MSMPLIQVVGHTPGRSRVAGAFSALTIRPATPRTNHLRRERGGTGGGTKERPPDRSGGRKSL
jgi:hypothetical protein